MGKQTYKLELLKKWRIYDVFHVLLLEQDIIRKRWVDESNAAKLDASNKSGEYKVEVIWDSLVYARESKSGHLPGLYSLVLWRRYLKEENIWELASMIQHLRKLINSFHKNHPDKPTAPSPAINTASPMARLVVKPIKPPKQKRGGPTKRHTAKRIK